MFPYKYNVIIKMSNVKKVLLGSASHFLPTLCLHKSLCRIKSADKFWCCINHMRQFKCMDFSKEFMLL